MGLKERYTHVLLGYVGMLLCLACFDGRAASLYDMNSLLPCLILVVPAAAIAKATFHRAKTWEELGPSILTVLGLGLLLAAHKTGLA